MPDDCPFQSREAADGPATDAIRRATRPPCFGIASLVVSLGCAAVGAGVHSLGSRAVCPGAIVFILPILAMVVIYLVGMVLTIVFAILGAMRRERAAWLRLAAMIVAALPLLFSAIARQSSAPPPGGANPGGRPPVRQSASGLGSLYITPGGDSNIPFLSSQSSTRNQSA